MSPESALSQGSPFSPNLPHFRGPSSLINLFHLIISSTTLAKFRHNRHFRQIRRFRQIRQHFGAPLARLIHSFYNLIDNLSKISPESPLSPNSPIPPDSPTFLGPSSYINIFHLFFSSKTLAKFRHNRHFYHIRCFRQIRQHSGTLVARLIHLPLLLRR